MFTTIIIFLLVLGLIIFVHELGHFVLAKRAGIKVEEFGFGFPPRIFGIKKGETIYSLNLLPLGGFVKIFGEDGKKEGDNNNDRAFYNKSVGTRAKILVAGVTMNILLAVFLLGIGHWIGLPAIIEGDEIVEGSRVQIVEVSLDSPADEAEIKMGDTIRELQISNYKLQINTVEDIQKFINNHKGDKVIVVLERGNQILEKEVVLRVDHPENQGSLGVALARTAIVSYPWYQSIYKGIVDVINLTGLIVVAFATIIWQLITTGKMIVDVAGPVGIFNLTGQAAQLGFIYLLQFTAILNINLAIINILPFPALDGGRLLFLAIEKIKGSPISQKIEGIAHTVGFAILIVLMLAVTWRDIIRIF